MKIAPNYWLYLAAGISVGFVGDYAGMPPPVALVCGAIIAAIYLVHNRII